MAVEIFDPNQTQNPTPRTSVTDGEMITLPAATSPKIGFVSLGCPKNLVDSERILTQLRTEGYEIV
ncbi:MAG: 30S ribosomal protein S12 methylthiotransferase RimO, partial [Vibrionaceae bacterium]